MSSQPTDPKPQVDLANEQIHWDLGESKSYGEYLNLTQLLSAQQPVSYERDEIVLLDIQK